MIFGLIDGVGINRLNASRGVQTRGWTLAVGTFGFVATLAVVLHFEIGPHELGIWLSARRAFVDNNPLIATAAYIIFYIGFALLSAPGAWVVSVTGGALFGPWIGSPLVVLSSTAGSTLAMLAARYLFRDSVAARFPEFVARVNRGVATDGARWLFAARLTPVMPYFAVNLAIGLTHMPASRFALVSGIGVAPLSILYVFAGSQFAVLEHPGDVLSLPVVAALLTLAASPFVLKAIARRGNKTTRD